MRRHLLVRYSVYTAGFDFIAYEICRNRPWQAATDQAIRHLTYA